MKGAVRKVMTFRDSPVSLVLKNYHPKIIKIKKSSPFKAECTKAKPALEDERLSKLYAQHSLSFKYQVE